MPWESREVPSRCAPGSFAARTSARPRSTSPCLTSRSFPLERPGSGTVLVVEDEEEVREVAEQILHDFGFATIPAVDGRDALDVMERSGNSITAVLLDISMPRIGGQETLRRLRALRPSLPVIMMSGYTEESVTS